MKKSKRKITCPYCGSPAILREGNYVYGEDSIAEKLYVCPLDMIPLFQISSNAL